MKEYTQLTFNELDNISGGNCKQTSDDSKFLQTLNHSCQRYGVWRIRNQAHGKEIEEAWKTVGVECKCHRGGGKKNENEYWVNGQRVTQAQARAYAMDYVGKYLADDDWNY